MLTFIYLDLFLKVYLISNPVAPLTFVYLTVSFFLPPVSLTVGVLSFNLAVTLPWLTSSPQTLQTLSPECS